MKNNFLETLSLSTRKHTKQAKCFLAGILLLICCVVSGYAADHTLLRVGTTGDYPPLTFYDEKTRQYSGFDIEMAKNIAHLLGKKVTFVKTTWSTLSADLAADRFDIAVGGISDTPDRRKQFLISDPILQDGKIPLARCADVGKYASLNKINQPDVRVVENLGGTNLKFAQKHLKNAQLIIVKENKTTADYLLQHKADVMITDRIEALYRQKKFPGLCAVNPQHLLTKSYKVYLIGNDNHDLLKAVNEWLVNVKQDEMRQLF